MNKATLLRTLILAFMTTSVLSCSNRSNQSESSYLLEVKNLKKINTADEISLEYKQVEVIPLETSDTCLLGDIYKVIDCNSNFFVQAGSAAFGRSELHKFDKNGRWITRLDKIGNGPGEISRFGSFTISGDTLLIYDDYKSVIACYDLNGKYLGHKKGEINPIGVSEIAGLNSSDRILVRSDINSYGTAIYSKIDYTTDTETATVVNHKFSTDDTFAECTAYGPITDWNESSKLIVLPFDNTLYALDINTYELSPVITVSDDMEIPAIQEGTDINEFKKELGDNYYKLSVSAVKSGDWIVILRRMGSLIWNYATKRGYYSLNGIDFSHVEAFPFLSSNIVGASDETGFISWMSAENFVEMRDSNTVESPEFMPVGDNANAVTSDDNPILVRYIMK